MTLRAIALVALLTAPAAAEAPWTELLPGLELGMFDGPPADISDGKIRVVRIDPARFELRLLNASAPGGDGKKRTAKQWAAYAGAVAAINASMYRDDDRTSVSLMRTRTHVNNGKLSKDKSILAFDAAPGRPAVRIIDRDCDDFAAVSPSYGTLVQSIRLVSCRRSVTWKRQAKRWSTAAIGVDKQGRALFIHARSPWSVHDFAARLLELPIALERAMYVEGGPPATLYVHAGRVDEEHFGGYETGVFEDDSNDHAWELPNVVVAVPRKR
jgi:hypothetical protein